MKTRQQKGYVWREGDWWLLRYRDSRVEDGKLVRRQLASKLAPVQPEHKRLTRPPQSVQKDQERFMARINASRQTPERNVTVGDFVRNVWLPFVESQHAASTSHHYRYYWGHLLGPLCGNQLLRDFATPRAQALLEQIARQNPTIAKGTLHKMKSILRAIFRLAIQQDYRPGPNPIRETTLPRAPEAAETVAYDLDTVLRMLQLVPEPSRTAMAVAAFAGLRRGEIEGLKWEAYDGETLKVMRAMWKGIAGEPKSRKSKAAVPVIAPLRKILDLHRLRSGTEAGIMFRTGNDTPLSMNNLLNDQILPAIEHCAECGQGKEGHVKSATHDFKRDTSLPEWHGFHAFRRGLATNLHELGVDDLTIQRILRHGDVSVTQRCYIKTLPKQTVNAMKQLERLVEQSELVCSQRAVTLPGSETVQ
jgi:integrase